MPECIRCGDFTDNSPEKQYHYCNTCLDEFDRIRENGVVVKTANSSSGYVITLPKDFEGFYEGREDSHVEALARGKWLSDELGLDALFEYGPSGSKWDLVEYLDAHPEIKTDVKKRINRIPNKRRAGFLGRIKNLLR